MRIIRGLHALGKQFVAGCVATIGNYDGMHLGHQQIIEIVKEKSIELNLPAVMVMFEPQPEEFFVDAPLARLTSLREKSVLLEQYGIDNIVLLPFNSQLASINAVRFVTEILVNLLKVKYLAVGDDFVFGCQRAGDFSLLEKMSVGGGFQVVEVPSFRIDGVRVSSSLIREALWSGNLAIASRLLGRDYRVSGKVEHGDQRGRTLGFPTANINLKRRKLPVVGVYIVKIYGLWISPLAPLHGIANVGSRPTVVGKQRLLEVHILDFDADIYGQRIVIEFCKKIRDEQKFGSLERLQLQIKKDLAVALDFFNNEI